MVSVFVAFSWEHLFACRNVRIEAGRLHPCPGLSFFRRADKVRQRESGRKHWDGPQRGFGFCDPGTVRQCWQIKNLSRYGLANTCVLQRELLPRTCSSMAHLRSALEKLATFILGFLTWTGEDTSLELELYMGGRTSPTLSASRLKQGRRTFAKLKSQSVCPTRRRLLFTTSED